MFISFLEKKYRAQLDDAYANGFNEGLGEKERVYDEGFRKGYEKGFAVGWDKGGEHGTGHIVTQINLEAAKVWEYFKPSSGPEAMERFLAQVEGTTNE